MEREIPMMLAVGRFLLGWFDPSAGLLAGDGKEDIAKGCCR